MNTSSDFPLDFFPEGHFDPAFMPRTFPANWDLSEMTAPLASNGAEEKNSASFAESKISPEDSEKAGLPEAFDLWFLESFPKLMTTPTQWDLSELV